MTTSADDLRALVREALRDVLPEVLAASAGLASAGPAGPPGPRLESVRVDDDHDLAALVARVLAAADDVRSGRLVFTLDRGPATSSSSGPATSSSRSAASPAGSAGPGPDGAGHHVARGAVTERQVRAAERAGGRLVLGPRAVLTPLARDRARSAGVEIVRTTSTDAGRH